MSSSLEAKPYGSSRSSIESSKCKNSVNVPVAELANFQSDVEGQIIDGERKADEEEMNVPRADGGKDAWLFLAGCFLFEALIWGE